MPLTYWKKYYDDSCDWSEVDYDTALNTLLTRWNDCDLIRDMLTIPNLIECNYSMIMVKDGNMVAMPGLKNLTPCDAEYDETGTRID